MYSKLSRARAHLSKILVLLVFVTSAGSAANNKLQVCGFTLLDPLQLGNERWAKWHYGGAV